MSSKQVTQADIARTLALSRSTVSRALSGNERIASQTRRRVMQEARRLGYVLPQDGRGDAAQAEDIQAGLKRVVGLLRTQELRRFYSEALLQMAECARAMSFTFEIVSSEEGEPLKNSIARVVADADGVILLSREEFGEEDAQLLQSLTVPVVLFGRHVEGLSHAVTFDDYAAGVMAARYLYRLGHRNIAYIPGPQRSSSQRERLAGFRVGLERSGCYNPALFVAPVEGESVSEVVSGVRSRMQELLALPKPPSAVWVLNDLAAGVAITTAQMAGFSVPGDISVMGFDHNHFTSPVSITTFDFQASELGRQAIRLLGSLSRHEVEGFLRICVAPVLVEGDSTGPPR